MRSGHRSAAVQNCKQPYYLECYKTSPTLQPPKPQASCTSPPATTVKFDTTECIPTDCPTSPSQPAAAPTERKPSSSSRRDNVLTVVVPPPNWHYLTGVKWQGDADNIWFMTPPTNVSTSCISVGSQVTGDTSNITSKFWPLIGYIWTTIG